MEAIFAGPDTPTDATVRTETGSCNELTLAFENVACDEGDEGIHQYYSELARELAAYSA